MCAISWAGVRVLAISRAVSKDMRAERPWETSMVVFMGVAAPLRCLRCEAASLSAFLMRGVRCKCLGRRAGAPRPVSALRRGDAGALRRRRVPWERPQNPYRLESHCGRGVAHARA